MLQKLRDQTQSFAFKVLVGAIIFVLAIFGFGAFNLFLTTDPSVASVNGEDITQSELSVEAERERRRLAAQFGENFDPNHVDVAHWTRGACQYGTLPCNGLVYAPTHPCACFIAAKLSSYNTLSGRRASPQPIGLTISAGGTSGGWNRHISVRLVSQIGPGPSVMTTHWAPPSLRITGRSPPAARR